MKKIYKFRYIFRFNVFNEILQNFGKIQTSYNLRKNYRFSEGDYESLAFSFNSMDKETYEKIECFLNLYYKHAKKNTCFYCMLKGDLICPNCGMFYYCSKLHQELDWNIFHFFDCNLIRVCKEIIKLGENNCTSIIKFFKLGYIYKNSSLLFNKILIEIFKNCKDQIDYQEYLIFLHFIIELFERSNVHHLYYHFLIKFLNYLPHKQESVLINIDKTILLTSCYYYFSLKLVYVKFTYESILQ